MKVKFVYNRLTGENGGGQIKSRTTTKKHAPRLFFLDVAVPPVSLYSNRSPLKLITAMLCVLGQSSIALDYALCPEKQAAIFHYLFGICTVIFTIFGKQISRAMGI